MILAHESGTNSVPGRKKASFPVTLRVFFRELISNPRTSTLMSLQSGGGMWEKKKEEGGRKKTSQRKKGALQSVLTSYNATFNGDALQSAGIHTCACVNVQELGEWALTTVIFYLS